MMGKVKERRRKWRKRSGRKKTGLFPFLFFFMKHLQRKWREKKEREAKGEPGPKEKKKVDKDTRNRMIDKVLRCQNCRWQAVCQKTTLMLIVQRQP